MLSYVGMLSYKEKFIRNSFDGLHNMQLAKNINA